MWVLSLSQATKPWWLSLVQKIFYCSALWDFSIMEGQYRPYWVNSVWCWKNCRTWKVCSPDTQPRTRGDGGHSCASVLSLRTYAMSFSTSSSWSLGRLGEGQKGDREVNEGWRAETQWYDGCQDELAKKSRSSAGLWARCLSGAPISPGEDYSSIVMLSSAWFM